MKSSRTAALLAAASLILGLTACGGSGDSGEASSSSTSSTPPAKTAPESPASSGKLAPPGAEFALGEETTVAWVPLSEADATKAQQGFELKASATAIEKRSIGDLSDLGLEPDEEEETPYFVKVHLEALGSAEPPTGEQPALEFRGIDDRGQEQQSVSILGSFPDCEEEEMPQPFTDGASYDSCFVYLVRKGGSIDSVAWTSGPSGANEVTPYFDEPVLWKGS
jgi:hypothetical protein